MIQGSHIITRCPQCSTQFRVTAGQLKIAQGQVRCGHCLAVFSAIEHSLDEPASHQTQTAKKTRPQAKQPRRAQAPKAKPSNPEPQSQPEPVRPGTPDQQPKPAATALLKTVSSPEGSVPTLTIQAEPVVLSKPEKPNTLTSTGWFFACLLALGVMLVQHLWFNRGDLYTTQTYRPLYTFICAHIDCHLPLRSDLSKIRSQAFHVRPHNEIENAITIDLVLLNEADFRQPFPALGIAFADLKKRPVAARILQPESYLDPTVVDPLAMPPQQPIQISLDLMSPGTRGVSYELELLAPTL
ncbi:zinc-ribbon and DUF3426 domain-containing protein [Neptuniibacter halophilus]|uniref:zinc-ribbon and DUF3426 domain-containing protein n=1 Tax=Neptuniibacter halophilus TaxID=651666 RepID=UPI0025745779|nr:DUF3426 domain-containing protein [Neptuniibacter halophilus]